MSIPVDRLPEKAVDEDVFIVDDAENGRADDDDEFDCLVVMVVVVEIVFCFLLSGTGIEEDEDDEGWGRLFEFFDVVEGDRSDDAGLVFVN